MRNKRCLLGWFTAFILSGWIVPESQAQSNRGADPLERELKILSQDPFSYVQTLEELVWFQEVSALESIYAISMGERASHLRNLGFWAASKMDARWLRLRLEKSAIHDDGIRRLFAIEALGLLGKSASIPALAKIVLQGQDEFEAVEAISALVKIGGKGALAVAETSMFVHTNEHVRLHSFWGVIELVGHPRAIGMLRRGLTDDRELIRQNASELLEVRSGNTVNEVPRRFRYRGGFDSIHRYIWKNSRKLDSPTISGFTSGCDRIRTALDRLSKTAPSHYHLVCLSLDKIEVREGLTTGVDVRSRTFSIRLGTVNTWTVDYLAEVLVHDAFHVYLYETGEKHDYHRGEEKCFQEAFWSRSQRLKHLGRADFDREIRRLLKNSHWTEKYDY
jgi:hypothetical protein